MLALHSAGPLNWSVCYVQYVCMYRAVVQQHKVMWPDRPQQRANLLLRPDVCRVLRVTIPISAELVAYKSRPALLPSNDRSRKGFLIGLICAYAKGVEDALGGKNSLPLTHEGHRLVTACF